MVGPEEILSFWLDEVSPEGWYRADDKVDAKIRERFLPTWNGLMKGRHALWLTYPSGSLAYIILADQFSRNMFRNSGKTFASDRIGLAAAKSSIDRNWDMRIDEPARQFFYLPLMHSENLCDQDRCIRLIKDRMPETGHNNLHHAKAHREVIRQFGRFPYRNDAIGRETTLAEKAYLASGGYGETVRMLDAAQAS